MTDVLGAVSTLLALALLAAGGLLGAERLLGGLTGRASRDRLSFAIAALLVAHAQAIGIALVLGFAGALRWWWAVGIQALIVGLLWLRRRGGPGLTGALASAIGERVRTHGLLSIFAGHVAAAEALRGLAQPPLSWDSLMYHLWLTTSWLHSGDILPPLGNTPANYYAYVPANGSLWTWWWMAPSHSEFYVNLASFPAALLVALAAGALARELGATRSWPLVSFATFAAPVVARYLVAQYVDLLLAGGILAALLFGWLWISSKDEPSTGLAVLAALAGGIAAGTKVLGPPYAAAASLALAAAAWPALRAAPATRLRQAIVALLVAAPFAGAFYARNVALGAGPLAAPCELTATGPEEARPIAFPRAHSVADRIGEVLADGSLADTYLGMTRPPTLEMGLGPLTFVWILFVGAAFFLRRDTFAGANALRWILVAQAAGQIAFWYFVPYAKHGALLSSLRYLIPTLAIGLALGYTWLERRGVSPQILLALTAVFVAQGLLQQHAEMPRSTRFALALVDLAIVVAALWPKVVPRGRSLAIVGGATGLVLLALVPTWTEFRSRERARSYKNDLAVHSTTARFQADAWDWLERKGTPGDVAHVQAPSTYFPYPPTGSRLERRVLTVNVNAANHRFASDYPRCQPQQDPDPQAWLENLHASGVRYLYLARFVEFPFPAEDEWAQRVPRVFKLEYQDPGNRIYSIDWGSSATTGAARGSE